MNKTLMAFERAASAIEETAAAGRLGPRTYVVSGQVTADELALVRVFGIALILLLIIVGMALSQYVINLFAA
jgi:hypothetical protein